jgi:hypothetical protein
MAHAYLFTSSPIEVVQRCTKVAYDSRRMAHRARGRMRQPIGVTAVGTGTLNVYKCRICAAWHLGHKGNG